MPRQPKPFFRKQTQSWYFSTGGKQYNLGKNREEAFRKFHELMADQEKLPSEGFTLYELSQVYLDWVQAHRKEATYKIHLHFLKSFFAHVGRTLKPSQLKPSQVSEWAAAGKLNSTSQAKAITVVQRMLNWAVEKEHLKSNPITGLKKPTQKRRDVVYTPQQWKKIRAEFTDEFGDLLDFMYYTGCRPQEARTLEARHVHDDIVIFPADEAKGESPRVLYLVGEARTIVDRLTKLHPAGPIFLNTNGQPWTKDSIKCRLNRVSKKLGFRCVAYAIRHSFATNALMNNVDPISVAHLLGHKNIRMVSEVYSHLATNPQFLKKQAKKALK
ncbi:MAG: site-specific integrase [Planctomycetaceae bacterium]|nr:site-specific integrase [Planctomycetaceae bacterium]